VASFLSKPRTIDVCIHWYVATYGIKSHCSRVHIGILLNVRNELANRVSNNPEPRFGNSVQLAFGHLIRKFASTKCIHDGTVFELFHVQLSVIFQHAFVVSLPSLPAPSSKPLQKEALFLPSMHMCPYCVLLPQGPPPPDLSKLLPPSRLGRQSCL